MNAPADPPGQRRPRAGRPVRRWIREFLELLAIPLACALLPWRVGLGLLRLLARWRGWYREEVELATLHARRAGFAPDPDAFAARLRLRLLVEGVDPFVVALRNRRRLVARWVRAHGDPLPESGPALFLGTHYGCGYWFVPFMAERGLPLNIVAPPMATVLQGANPLQRLFRRTRLALLARAAGRPLVHRGGAFEAMLAILARGDVGFGLCDLPTSRSDATAVELAGRGTRLSPAMFRLAARASVPTYLFWSDIDLATGQRHVQVQCLRAGSEAGKVEELARMLSARIEADPSGWRFWSIGSEFFPELAVPLERD